MTDRIIAFTISQFSAMVVLGGFGAFMLGCGFALHRNTRPLPPHDVDDLAATCYGVSAVVCFVVIAPVIVRWLVG